MGLLILWSVFFKLLPDLAYRSQKAWFPVSRESYTLVMYSFMGLFKALVIVFNMVPWVALAIISS